MKASEFDRKFDEGESVLAMLDFTSARKPNLAQRKVNVDFPIWMIESLDRAARRLGVTRQSVIKMWLAERLEHEVTTPRDTELFQLAKAIVEQHSTVPVADLLNQGEKLHGETS